MSYVAELTLLSLPADNVRKIISYCLEDFNCIQLISPRWCDLTVEYLEHRSHLPSIQSFRWTVIDGRSTLSIRVQKKFQKYFGLQRWTCPHPIEDSDQYVELVSVEPSILEQLTEFEKAVNRCSRIDTVEVDVKNLGNFSGIALLKWLMRQSNAIGSLTISGNQPNFAINGSTILRLAEASKVQHLAFVSNVPGAIDFKAFFPYLGQFFKRVSTVELILKQCWSATNPNVQQEANSDRKVGCLELVEALKNTGTVHSMLNESPSDPKGRIVFCIKISSKVD